MANKYDLKTWVRQSLIGTATAGAAGNACIGSNTAATGKTRFLTYLRVTRRAVASAMGSMTIALGDATTSNPAASTVSAEANAKLLLLFPPANTVGAVCDAERVQEIQGSIEHPIVAVAGGTYMGIAALSCSTGGSSFGVFATYYDE
jgi:hypothetical protein